MSYNLTNTINHAIQLQKDSDYNESTITSIKSFLEEKSYQVNYENGYANCMWIIKDDQFQFMIWTLFPMIISKGNQEIIEELNKKFFEFSVFAIKDNQNMLDWEFCIETDKILENNKWKWDSSEDPSSFTFECFKLVL